jgi:hypothetical protein
MSIIAAIFTWLFGLSPILFNTFSKQKNLSDNEKKLNFLLVFLISVGLLVSIYNIHNDTKTLKDTRNTLENTQNTLGITRDELAKANTKLDEIGNKAGSIDGNLSAFLVARKSACENLRNNGKSDPGDMKNIINACDELIKIYRNLNFIQATREKKIKVDWYVKGEDDINIKNYLESLGLTVDSHDSNKNVSSSNSIWYGSDVDPRLVKATAYTLIASGGKLKMIRRFYSSPKKARTIELAGDNTCTGFPLKAELIEKMPDFPQKKLENEPCPKSLKNTSIK